jgi:hypothetical protein
VLRRGTRHVINRAATALRIAATTLLRSQSYLGAQFRASAANSARQKRLPPWPISSLSWSIACSAGGMSTWTGIQYYEERHRQQQIHLLRKRATAWACMWSKRSRSIDAVSGERFMSVVLPCARLDTVHAGPLQSEGEPGRLGVLSCRGRALPGTHSSHRSSTTAPASSAMPLSSAASIACLTNSTKSRLCRRRATAGRLRFRRRAGGPVPLADCATGLHRAHDLS